MFSLSFLGVQLIGVWSDYSKGKVFVSLDYLKETRYIFSITREDNRPNVMMLKALKQYSFWKFFEQNFIFGNVYFENQKIKAECQEFTRIIKAF